MRAADGSGDTLSLQEKAPSRGMRYLAKIISLINIMLPQETHHHLLVRIHFETRTRREKKAPHAPTHGFMAHMSALGLVLIVCCSMLQQMDVEAEARATEEDRVNTTTCMPGIYDNKILIDDEKAMLIPTQVSRDTRADNNKSSVYTLET